MIRLCEYIEESFYVGVDYFVFTQNVLWMIGKECGFIFTKKLLRQVGGRKYILAYTFLCLFQSSQGENLKCILVYGSLISWLMFALLMLELYHVWGFGFFTSM